MTVGVMVLLSVVYLDFHLVDLLVFEWVDTLVCSTAAHSVVY